MSPLYTAGMSLRRGTVDQKCIWSPHRGDTDFTSQPHLNSPGETV